MLRVGLNYEVKCEVHVKIMSVAPFTLSAPCLLQKGVG